MAYPEEIITDLNTKYNLSLDLQRQLRDRLMLDQIHAAVETATFDPENLLLPIILPQSSSPNFFVLSETIAKTIITNKPALDELRVYAQTHAAAWLEWQIIKTEILHLKDKSLHEKRSSYKSLDRRTLDINDFLLNNPLMVLDYNDVAAPMLQYRAMSTGPIKQAATQYFNKLFSDTGREITNIQFMPKDGSGIQLGVRMIISYREQLTVAAAAEVGMRDKRVIFYIKTHQEGSTSQASSKKPVDPKELFVYKLLEYTGYGPKAHFFYDALSSGSGFYIATQDIAFTKVDGKIKTFNVFDQMKDSYNTAPEHPQYEEARRALISLDILSRILRLRDTTTNPGNFGRITVAADGSREERYKWKILDFRVLGREDADLYENPKIYTGFEEGNGTYNYDYTEFLRYVFKNKAFESQKMTIAHDTIAALRDGRVCQSKVDMRKMSFSAAVARAYQEITDYVKKNHDSMRLHVDTVLKDLEQYVIAICANFKTLEAGIIHKSSELESKVGILAPASIIASSGQTNEAVKRDGIKSITAESERSFRP